QAEDGIRDFHVTGVQTCALPIYEDVEQCVVVQHLVVRDAPGEDHRVACLPLLGQALQLGTTLPVTHDQRGRRYPSPTQHDRGLDQQLLPLAVVVQVADVAEGEPVD